MRTVNIVKIISLLIISVTSFVFTAEQTTPKYTGFPENIIFNEEDCPNNGILEAFYFDGDNDGAGNPNNPTPDDGNSYPIYACSTTPPIGYVTNNLDSSDVDANVCTDQLPHNKR